MIYAAVFLEFAGLVVACVAIWQIEAHADRIAEAVERIAAAEEGWDPDATYASENGEQEPRA